MTTHTTAQKTTCHTPAGHGPHHLMLGTVAVSRLLGGEDTDQQLAVLEVRGLPGSGPGPHLDPWRESFYVLEGELTFRVEQDGAVRHIVARPGDALTIPSRVGHAFAVSSANSARSGSPVRRVRQARAVPVRLPRHRTRRIVPARQLRAGQAG